MPLVVARHEVHGVLERTGLPAEGPHREERRPPRPRPRIELTTHVQARALGAAERTFGESGVATDHHDPTRRNQLSGRGQVVLDAAAKLDPRVSLLRVRRRRALPGRHVRGGSGHEIEALESVGVAVTDTKTVADTNTVADTETVTDTVADIETVADTLSDAAGRRRASPRRWVAKVARNEPHASFDSVARNVARRELEAHVLRFDAHHRELRASPRDHQEHRAETTAEITCARELAPFARTQRLTRREHVVEAVAMTAHALPDAEAPGERVVGERIVGTEHGGDHGGFARRRHPERVDSASKRLSATTSASSAGRDERVTRARTTAAFLTLGSTSPNVSTMASEERSELRGTTLEGRYRLGACIGVGGTGVVFEATRISDGHSVVVKTLRPVFAFHADLVRRLRREGEVARRVAHPSIVPVHDEGLLTDGSPFLVMERIGGEPLHRLLHRVGILDAPEALAIVRRVCDVLHRAHAFGYVHRDVKPEHVVLGRNVDGDLTVRLLDFGVCAADTAPTDERERERGRVFGTPSYVSPEQACGDPDVDARADVFGLGVVLFESLAGRVPFSGSTVTNLLRRIIREDAPTLSQCAPQISPELDSLVARMLARKREDRFPSARAVSRAIAPLLPDVRATERRLAAALRVGGSLAGSATTVHQTAA